MKHRKPQSYVSSTSHVDHRSPRTRTYVSVEINYRAETEGQEKPDVWSISRLHFMHIVVRGCLQSL